MTSRTTIRLATATVAAAVAVASAAGSARAEDAPASASVAQARAAYEKRHLAAQSVKAVELFEQAIAADATYDVLWEGARAASHLGQNAWAKVAQTKRLDLFAKGLRWAEQATKVRADGAAAHYYVAVLTGLHARERSFVHQMTTARSIRLAAERALKLDPSVECGGPPRLLGMYYRALPAAFGGDDTQAKRYFEQALRHCPDDAELHYALAECLNALGDAAGARRAAQWVLDHPPTSPRELREYEQIRRDTAALLADLD